MKIFNGDETRTNLMVKNVPCRYSQAEIRTDFDKNHKNRFNDLKVPMDKLSSEKTGKGYCFMNFRHILFVFDFFHDKKGYHWPKFASDKQIDINYAKE
jgi:RNA recognition motif-containing protein